MSKTLNTVADVYYGKRQNEVVDDFGAFPIIGTGGIFGSARIPLFKGPAIVVGRKGTLDSPQYVSCDFWTVDTAYAVLPKEGTHAKWLYYVLCASQLEKLNESTGVPSINRDRLYAVPVGDIHYEEQSRIAAVLDTVDEMIEKTEAVIAKLRQVRTGLLHDLLTCGLDENGQLRDPVAHPEQFQDSPLGLIPKAWEIRTVGQLIAGFESGVSVDSVDTPAAEGEIGVLKTGCITGGVFVLQENKRVKTQDLGRVRCNPKEDCLIISRMNTPQLVGESAYVSLDCEYVYLPDRLWQTIKYPGDPTCIRWLGYVVQEKEFREAVTGGATGTSGSMKNITQSFFLSLPVRVPPRQEQELIAKTAVHHDEGITTEQDYRDKLKQLKSGLMDDLLTGRVRVPEVKGGAL